jgi:membrane protein EpsK
MQNSSNEAKKRLLANVITSVMVVAVNTLIAIWIIPYLIKHLGIEVYGMIPLVFSFIAYFNLVSKSIAGALTRYTAIYLNKGEVEKSNIYFNSALQGIAALCGILLIPVILLSLFFYRLFQVPPGLEVSSGWLCFLVLFSSFMMAITTPFLVSTFVRHRFDLSNLLRITSKLLQVFALVLSFTYLSKSLVCYGLSYCIMALFFLASSILLARCLTPELKVIRNTFQWSALREMGSMSTWITVYEVGGMLYLGVSFIIINIFLGPEQCGRFGPIAAITAMLATLASTISNVFIPIAYEYVARDKMEILVSQVKRLIRFMSLMMGLPIGLICGLSEPILKCWLGITFVDLSPLIWLLVGPFLISVSVVPPIMSVFRGLDKVKVPAIITLINGAMNIAFSTLFVYYTHLGIYGIGISLLVCLLIKNFLFTPIYAAAITSQSKTIFIKEIVPGLIMAMFLSLVALGLSKVYDLATIPLLLAAGISLSISYSLLCYGFAMSKEDKLLLQSLIFQSKRTS